MCRTPITTGTRVKPFRNSGVPGTVKKLTSNTYSDARGVPHRTVEVLWDGDRTTSRADCEDLVRC